MLKQDRKSKHIYVSILVQVSLAIMHAVGSLSEDLRTRRNSDFFYCPIRNSTNTSSAEYVMPSAVNDGFNPCLFLGITVGCIY